MIFSFYQFLFSLYGQQYWWPCRSNNRWEIIAGAILTQNCSWTNVEKALENLEKIAVTTPESVFKVDLQILQNAIKPAGFYNQKSVYLKEIAQFFIKNEQYYLLTEDVYHLRNMLLKVKGIGKETADSILLYAFNKLIFVIDTYTRRVASRHLHLNGDMAYDELQKVFMTALPLEVNIYNEYHALIVEFCKRSCKKSGCGNDCHVFKL